MISCETDLLVRLYLPFCPVTGLLQARDACSSCSPCCALTECQRVLSANQGLRLHLASDVLEVVRLPLTVQFDPRLIEHTHDLVRYPLLELGFTALEHSVELLASLEIADLLLATFFLIPLHLVVQAKDQTALLVQVLFDLVSNELIDQIVVDAALAVHRLVVLRDCFLVGIAGSLVDGLTLGIIPCEISLGSGVSLEERQHGLRPAERMARLDIHDRSLGSLTELLSQEPRLGPIAAHHLIDGLVRVGPVVEVLPCQIDRHTVAVVRDV